MGAEHVSTMNPAGWVHQCQMVSPHKGHEYQASFGDYWDSWCPGIPDAAPKGNLSDQAREECRRELAKVMGVPDDISWPTLLNTVGTMSSLVQSMD